MKEERIYLVDADNFKHESEYSDEDDMDQAVMEGTVYSLNFFVVKWNVEVLDIANTWIRIL